jgi:FlaA1/EpsC-like NDP-sugar epimerase
MTFKPKEGVLRIYTIFNRINILPRWIIILIDLGFLFLSAFLGNLLRFNFLITHKLALDFVWSSLVFTSLGFVSIMITRSYMGIVRYTGLRDGLRIIYMLTLAVTFAALINIISSMMGFKFIVPFSVLIIAYGISFLLLFNYRLLVKNIFSVYSKHNRSKRKNVLIYGAGKIGINVRNMLESSQQYNVLGFIDDSLHKAGKNIDGLQVLPFSENMLDSSINSYAIDELMIAVRSLSAERKNELADICLENQVKVRIIPPVSKWINGELSMGQVKDLNIDYLLERDVIRLNSDNVANQLRGKSVMITGAAGSIGAEIVRQIMQFFPARIILIDQAESPLHELDNEVRSQKTGIECASFVADITNALRMQSIMKEYRPQVVYHAAAYKHVPVMERNPFEAVSVNVLGTKILADLAIEFNVEKFVFVSTDKAVNPTNIMGCSKRIAEIYVQSYDRYLRLLGRQKTQFVTTRFGNVLGSNGSVIPVFKKQIEAGGPVTVTHPDITRYFMTIPEACQLVLEAGAMGRGGEIFIFDMGKSVKVVDLAKKMIMLAGYDPNKDIDIVYSGLREGEKLYEELLANKEDTVPTHHKKIMIAKVGEEDYSKINSYINLLSELMYDANELKMVTLMKEIVPEFKSNYSRFEVLDSESF